MGTLLLVIGGVYGLSVAALIGGGVLWLLSRRFRREITGESGPR